MISWPFSPRMRRRPRGPLSPIPFPVELFLLRAFSRDERVERSGAVSFAGVVDGEALLAEGGEEGSEARDDGEDGCYVVALVMEVAFFGADWRALADVCSAITCMNRRYAR